MTRTVDLPRKFWVDRAERGLPMPKIFKVLSSKIRVDADDAAMADYLDDAVYYSDIISMSGDFGRAGLQASARATVKAIRNA